MAESDLAPFFSPRGVAVIGASQDPTKLGYGLARNLVQSNYQGVIHFVNPRGGSLLGRPMYPQVGDVPDPVDLAIVLIPARSVPESLVEIGERGIRAAIIGSGGFRETGAEGAALEQRCLEVARQYRLRLLGPNCIGILDTHLPIDATFLPPPGPLPGDVAFISHSGAICAAVIDWARGQGFGLSRLVSLGNQADVSETDVLAPVVADPFTRVLTLYLEGVSDGRRFVAEASRVSQVKPVIALKVGRFSSGQRAVASHTGALAGQETAFNAAFRRAGVIRADTSEELFDWARALAWCPLPQGRSVAILTNAGGPGVTAADALEANHMQLSRLSPATVAALQAFLPPAASLHNPVDILASASPEQFARSLGVLLEDAAVDAVLVIMPPPPMFTAGAVAKAIIPVILAASKPVVVALMGERLIQEAVEHFRASRVPEYRFPERAASALSVLAQRAEYLRRAGTAPEPCCDVNTQAARRILDEKRYHLAGGNAILSQEDAARLLAAYGIPTPPVRLAKTAAEAVALAQALGVDGSHPVVLKIESPDIVHKSDVGGVMIGLTSPSQVGEGFEAVVARARSLRPKARIHGVIIQPAIPAGQEVIIGAVCDPQFGPLAMFGSGGVEVEGLKDVSFALAPLAAGEAENMIESTWAGRKLGGFRNLPAVDRQAACQALIRLAQLAADFPEIEEIEVNPLRVLAEGAVALDARVRVSVQG